MIPQLRARLFPAPRLAETVTRKVPQRRTALDIEEAYQTRDDIIFLENLHPSLRSQKQWRITNKHTEQQQIVPLPNQRLHSSPSMTTQTLPQTPHLNPSEEVGPNIATSVHRTSQLQTSSIKPTSTKNSSKSQPEDHSPYLSKIALSHQTPFQKKVLTLLCQVPRGEHTTYAALAKHLSSSPRAVGNALRNNPFAPQVPCHRVLASDGRIGGFKGSWGRKGKEGANDGQKRSLLKGEGVRFDSGGRVVGRAWDAFR